MYRECIGQGTYGKVYRQGNRITKVFKDVSEDPISQSVLREIGFYQYFTERGCTLIPKLFSFSKKRKNWEIEIEWGGEEIHNVKWSSQEDKYKVIRLLITSLVYLQANEKILHRDLKPQNILWNGETIKIIDWGLSTCSSVRTKKLYTETVQTLHWRAPEVLLYENRPDHYTSKIDVWSVGIIVFHLLTGIQFPGDCEVDQLFKYFRIFGTPTKDFAPSLKKRKHFMDSFPVWVPRDLSCYRDTIEAVGTGFYDLLMNRILVLDPILRISPEMLKVHPLVKKWLKFYPSPFSSELTHVPFPSSSLTPISFHIYEILADWLLEVSFKFRLDITSLSLCLALIHQYLVMNPGTSRTKFQLVGVASLFLATCWCEIWPPEIADLAYICDNAYTQKEIKDQIVSVVSSGISILRCHINLPMTIFYKHHHHEDTIESRKAYLLLFRDMIHRKGHFSDDPFWLVKRAVDIVSKNEKEDTLPFRPANNPSLLALKKCFKSPYRFSHMTGYTYFEMDDDTSPLFAEFSKPMDKNESPIINPIAAKESKK